VISTSPLLAPDRRATRTAGPCLPVRVLWSAPGARLFATLWGGLAVVDVVRGAGTVTATACLVLLAVACSRHQPVAVAAGVGVVAWCLLTGFVVDGTGALRVDGTGDLVRLGVLVGAAVATALVTALVTTLASSLTTAHAMAATADRDAR
jgi:hypothetical protein